MWKALGDYHGWYADSFFVYWSQWFLSEHNVCDSALHSDACLSSLLLLSSNYYRPAGGLGIIVYVTTYVAIVANRPMNPCMLYTKSR